MSGKKSDDLPSHAQMAAKLLRDAALLMRALGEQNQPLHEQMEANARVYDQVADLVEKDPTGTLPG